MAYMRRGTARKSLIRYKEAVQGCSKYTLLYMHFSQNVALVDCPEIQKTNHVMLKHEE